MYTLVRRKTLETPPAPLSSCSFPPPHHQKSARVISTTGQVISPHYLLPIHTVAPTLSIPPSRPPTPTYPSPPPAPCPTTTLIVNSYQAYIYATESGRNPPLPPRPLWNIPPSPHRLYELQDVRGKRMHSFHNCQICPPKRVCSFRAHRFSFPRPNPLARPSFSPPAPNFLFCLLTPLSSHRLYDLLDNLDKLMHFLPQLTYFVPLNYGFYNFRASKE